jgi:ribonuclease D
MNGKDKRKMRYQTINDNDGLEIVKTSVKQEKIIAVDLEADSMYHFKEKVCLIQLATPKQIFIVDPLSVNDLSPLKPVFANRSIKKIFHGADYDVRSLYRDFKIVINNLFDTQLASMFLGIKETGLEAVLQQRFQVSLNKKYQRKDWSVRPLPEEMVEYAARDVRHLIPLVRILESELEQKGRLTWVREECERLSRVRPLASNRKPLFHSFKGAGRLDPRSLAVLEALLQYRRKVARRKDKPLFKILGNRILLNLAKEKPTRLKQLERLKILSPKQWEMHSMNLVEAVRRAMSLPEKGLPKYPRKKAPVLPAQVPDRIKKLKSWRDTKARRLGMDPGLMCSKSIIQAVAVAKPIKMSEFDGIDEMKKWQKKTFGKEMLTILKESGN